MACGYCATQRGNPETEVCRSLNHRATSRLYSRRIADEFSVNRKRVQRLMRIMGLEAIYPKPRTTVRCPEHKIYETLASLLGNSSCTGMVQGLSRIETSGGLSVT